MYLKEPRINKRKYVLCLGKNSRIQKKLKYVNLMVVHFLDLGDKMG
jgi:hypothetical protein